MMGREASPEQHQPWCPTRAALPSYPCACGVTGRDATCPKCGGPLSGGSWCGKCLWFPKPATGRQPSRSTTEESAMRGTATDHRNGHHTGRDRSCWRCTIRALLGRTPKAQRPQGCTEACSETHTYSWPCEQSA